MSDINDASRYPAAPRRTSSGNLFNSATDYQRIQNPPSATAQGVQGAPTSFTQSTQGDTQFPSPRPAYQVSNQHSPSQLNADGGQDINAEYGSSYKSGTETFPSAIPTGFSAPGRPYPSDHTALSNESDPRYAATAAQTPSADQYRYQRTIEEGQPRPVSNVGIPGNPRLY